jgi:hypothetical protein
LILLDKIWGSNLTEQTNRLQQKCWTSFARGHGLFKKSVNDKILTDRILTPMVERTINLFSTAFDGYWFDRRFDRRFESRLIFWLRVLYGSA